ncbi:hypothetical protein MVLG_03743 [Microbotryum lychnidis-dioicae p1A1 Lamole]|uniref:GST C-terminal domain-containing protein n=1 Tax=Microbotryum lychnidis-dioicae (strain p1A1 Lamole / MvSl-1064) TaxID=683840 RepID=U5H948_USTV1|nr:hypothetical protein MVLG_03743 [Microbotryum lychnidis-dioicae p1A1 Lamole]|eukprot:KDE05930.1 hypothetical protein MVLG_03743 [Microbotryum lychnidis-dioicae p1A1 Lamole]
MKEEFGTKVGKSPALRDGDLLIVESSAILTYVTTCGADGSEVGFVAHALPITYAAWFIPDEYEKAHQGFHDSLKPNVINDLNYLEAELEKKVERFRKKNGQGAFLVGQDLTIADIQVALPIEYIFTHPTISKELKDEIRGYTQIKVWLRGLEARPAYKEATKVAECLCFA